MGAAILSVPELELDAGEARQYADALTEVAKFYTLSFDPKKVAIVNLLVVAGKIYGTRLFAYSTRRKLERREAAKSDQAGKPGPVPVAAQPKPNGRAATPQPMSPSDLWPEPAAVRGSIW
jgi:hypothetical protein